MFVLQAAMTKLNPEAASFYPSPNPNFISMEPYHQGYIVSSPSPVTPLFPPPPPPYYQQPYFFGAAREDAYHLYPRTTIDSAKKHEDASKRDSRRRFFRAMINGYGRRMDARHTKGFRPPPLARRPNGTGGCDRQIQEGTLGNFKVSPRNKKTKHTLVPVQRETNTTIMIRNIPNRYTRAMLIDFLDNHCLSENLKLASKEEGGERPESAFDLVYLPIDFNSGMNKGYGFVNFTNPEAAWRFYVATNSKKWEFFQSHKVCDNVAARLQGKDKLVAHLNSMMFPADRDEVLPVCFSPPRNGTIKGSQKTLGKPNNRLCNNLVSGGSSRPSVCQWKEKTASPAVQHVSS